MGMVVRTNTMALNAYRQLGMNNSAVTKSLEKLSSGFRINRAGDDAAGLAISEKMKAQITGLETASANAQDESAFAGPQNLGPPCLHLLDAGEQLPPDNGDILGGFDGRQRSETTRRYLQWEWS